jgi:voltage-gated potassium channel
MLDLTKERRHQEIILSLAAIVLALSFGTSGYSIIEGWSLFDSFYMTVITLATIGYGETHPLSFAGRAFTIVFIFLGLGVGSVIVGSLWRTVLETQIGRIVERRHKVQDKIEKVSEHTIFCGFSRLGRTAAQELRRGGTTVVIIEKDEVRADEADAAGFLVIRGDATLDDTLMSAGILRASRLVSLLPRDSDNLYVILTAREMNPSLYIVSRAEDEVGEKRLKRAGVNRLISTYRLAARKLADGLMRPYITDFFEIAGTGDEGWKIEEIKIPASSPVCGQNLKDLSLRQKANVSIAAIISPGGELELNPSGDTILQSGSTLIAIGWKKDIQTLEGFVLPR